MSLVFDVVSGWWKTRMLPCVLWRRTATVDLKERRNLPPPKTSPDESRRHLYHPNQIIIYLFTRLHRQKIRHEIQRVVTFLGHVVHAVGHGRVLLSGVQEQEASVVVDEMIIWEKRVCIKTWTGPTVYFSFSVGIKGLTRLTWFIQSHRITECDLTRTPVCRVKSRVFGLKSLTQVMSLYVWIMSRVKFRIESESSHKSWVESWFTSRVIKHESDLSHESSCWSPKNSQHVPSEPSQ